MNCLFVLEFEELCLFWGHLGVYNMRVDGARGVMVIVAGYGHGDTSSNPGPD